MNTLPSPYSLPSTYGQGGWLAGRLGGLERASERLAAGNGQKQEAGESRAPRPSALAAELALVPIRRGTRGKADATLKVDARSTAWLPRCTDRFGPALRLEQELLSG